MICLHTNAVIALINDTSKPLRERIRSHLIQGDTIALSSIVFFELWFGAAKSARRAVNAELIAGIAAGPMITLPFDYEDAVEAGDIQALLERKGTPIGPYDLLIAAQARRRGALLVTANRREFTRVKGLKVENWLT
jgi:tRNA(fMet)-specific endonuclease VapC